MPHCSETDISPRFYFRGHLLVGRLEILRHCFLKVDEDDGGEQLVDSLLIGNISVDFAPYEQHVRQQFENVSILEEVHLLVSAVHILSDLLEQEAVRILNKHSHTTSFFYVFTIIAFINGFFGNGGAESLRDVTFTPVRASSLSRSHRFLLAYKPCFFCGQSLSIGTTSNSILHMLKRGKPLVLH